MLLTCPDCAAEYNVPDHVMDGAPVTLRCVRCSREWEAGGARSEPVSPEEAPPEHHAGPMMPSPLQVPPAPLEHPHADIAHNHAIRRGVAGWMLSVILVGLVIWAAIQWRQEVMASWPPSQRAYQAIGLN
jgi:predicted Zn finger-like uncharacterized protein